MPVFSNPTGQTVVIRDLNLNVLPSATVEVSSAQAAQSWDLGVALEQGSLTYVSGGSWRLGLGDVVDISTIQPAVTQSGPSSGATEGFWVGSYNSMRLYTAVISGDLTWSYQSSPDGGSTWFPHAELSPVTLAAVVSGSTITPAYESYLVENLGVMGQLAWATTSGVTFAARVALKS